MADNSTVGSPVGTGDTIRDKDRAGVKTQIVGLDLNIGGSETLMAGAMPTDLTTTAVADGGTLPTKGVQVGGTDGSVFQVLSTDSAGRANVNVNGTVPVSGGLTDTQLRARSVPVDTELPAAAALADGTANPTTSVIEAMLGCYNGTTWDRVRGDTTNGLFVNVKTSVLPTGASTSAKQPALGTAGTPSADVISVQGVASGTVLPVSGTVTANLGTANVTNAGTFAVQADTELPAAAALADAASNPTAPATGAFGMLWNGATWDRAPGTAANGATTNLSKIAGTAVDTNSGNKSAGTQRVTLATDQVQLTNALKTDPSGVTSPVSLASLPALATGSNLIGRVNVEPETTGGLTIFHLVSAATTNATNVKASAGQLYGWYIYNSNSIARKVALHNTAGTPTAGASVAFAIVIPPTSAANVEFAMGIAFATGIGITTVTDLTDAGATAVAASDLIINLFFK